jgi:hypothetical protein
MNLANKPTQKKNQVVTKLFSSGYQDLFALLRCYHLVTKLMTVSHTLLHLLQVVPRRLTHAIYRLFVTSCYELVGINLLTTCDVEAISDLLEQLVASMLASSTLLQDDNLFQTCEQLTTGNKRCEHISLTSCEIFTRAEDHMF